MRTENEIISLILDVAKADNRIRAVYMMGSRVNPNVPKDDYQDYDICYVVTETASFLADKNWITIFGEPLIISEPDKNDASYGHNKDFDLHYTWLMIFKDGVRIDLGVQIKDKMLKEYEKEKLILTLLDKDNIIPITPPPTDKDYYIKKPNEDRLHGCCSEFWWCLNNVAKGIARDELSYAMWMYNGPVREKLVEMLEYYIGINTNFNLSSGKLGKYFKKYLPAELYKMYAGTYCDSDYEHLWDSIFIACKLFHIAAIEVSRYLKHKYNSCEEDGMIEYLSKVKRNYNNLY